MVRPHDGNDCGQEYAVGSNTVTVRVTVAVREHGIRMKVLVWDVFWFEFPALVRARARK